MSRLGAVRHGLAHGSWSAAPPGVPQAYMGHLPPGAPSHSDSSFQPRWAAVLRGSGAFPQHRRALSMDVAGRWGSAESLTVPAVSPQSCTHHAQPLPVPPPSCFSPQPHRVQLHSFGRSTNSSCCKPHCAACMETLSGPTCVSNCRHQKCPRALHRHSRYGQHPERSVVSCRKRV